jgi:hypothetical protein
MVTPHSGRMTGVYWTKGRASTLLLTGGAAPQPAQESMAGGSHKLTQVQDACLAKKWLRSRPTGGVPRLVLMERWFLLLIVAGVCAFLLLLVLLVQVLL